jgi:hypothetical protein
LQAVIGNITKGSAFAIAQSIATGGTIPVAVSAIGTGLGVGAGIAGAGIGSDGEDKEGDQNDEGAGQDETGEDAKDEDLIGEGNRRGGHRCPECKRRGERYCRHGHWAKISAIIRHRLLEASERARSSHAHD